jgi:hypothetical protein
MPKVVTIRREETIILTHEIERMFHWLLRKCRYCGDETDGKSRYCSLAHKQAAYRERKAWREFHVPLSERSK